MLFVTNRTPEQSIRSRAGRRITFDLQNTSVSQNLFFCRRTDPDEYEEIGSHAFFSELKAPDGAMQVLLYIHGFNNTGEQEVFPRAKLLEDLVNKMAGRNLVQVVPLIWPCDDDSIVAILDDYWDDQQSADRSGCTFARLLGKFDDWRCHEDQQKSPCTKRINVLAHSMGARVLRNALRSWAHHYGGGQVPQLFRNVFLVAADLVNHTLERGQEGRFIPDSARNVVVYYANDDLAMPASKLANLKSGTVSRRLGMTGPEDICAVPRNVYEADCDEFNNTFNPPKGHSYFLTAPNGDVSPVLEHIADVIETGRVSGAGEHRHILLSP